MSKKVCFFGSYDSISLDCVLKERLKSKGIEVIECQESVHSFGQLIKAYFTLLKKHHGLEYSIMIIPWRGIMTFPLAKFLSKKPIIFFSYVSIYDTLIMDRKKYKEKSLIAKFIKFVEKKACQMSDLVVLENNETVEYFSREYSIPKNKFRVFNWGADEKKFSPLLIKKKEKVFRVLYFGTYIPFHGVNTIIESARLIQEHKDIKFILCGKGQTLKENKTLTNQYNLSNVEFLGHVEFEVLKKELNESDVCLGVFGDSNLRSYVFTNKISQILMSQKPLITRDVSVMKEMSLANNKNCILVAPNNSRKLADAIIFLKDNDKIREKIALEGYHTINQVLSKSWDKFWNETLEPNINNELN